MEKLVLLILLHCDSTTTIDRVRSHYYNDKSRSIRRKYCIMRLYLCNGIINVNYIKSSNNFTDQLIKALVGERIWNTLRDMGSNLIQS